MRYRLLHVVVISRRPIQRRSGGYAPPAPPPFRILERDVYFDTVSHTKLLCKLQAYGFDGELHCTCFYTRLYFWS